MEIEHSVEHSDEQWIENGYRDGIKKASGAVKRVQKSGCHYAKEWAIFWITLQFRNMQKALDLASKNLRRSCHLRMFQNDVIK